METNPLRNTVNRVRNGIILMVLALTILFTEPVAERYGDRLQVALPLLALGCSVVTGGAGEYLIRLATLEIVVHGSKAALGDLPMNQRPNGSGKGFPSGHTAAAAFGASALLHECIQKSPVVKAVVVISAGFVGASRIEAEKHNIWQVLAGVLTGYIIDRALRRNQLLRAWLKISAHRGFAWLYGAAKIWAGRAASGLRGLLGKN